MEETEIIVDIDPEGNARISVRGVAGPRCLELTGDLEAFLGITRSRQRTAEYFEPEPVRGERKEHEKTGF